MNGNKFATGEILEKPVEVVKGRILAGWAQKSPGPCSCLSAQTIWAMNTHISFFYSTILYTALCCQWEKEEAILSSKTYRI